jgi:hypothetical protein
MSINYGENSQDIISLDSSSYYDQSDFPRQNESSDIIIESSSASGRGSQMTNISPLNERKYLLITNNDLIQARSRSILNDVCIF